MSWFQDARLQVTWYFDGPVGGMEMFTDRVLRRVWLLAPILVGCVLHASAVFSADGQNSTGRYAAWAAKISDQLRLNPTQQVAFNRTLSALTPTPPAAGDIADKLRAMTAPERLDYLNSQIESGLTKARAVSREMHTFYALLTVEQRSLFDDAMRPKVFPGGPPESVVGDPAPTAPNLQLPSHTNPDWRTPPNADDIGRVYPAAALQARLAGRVIMDCVADENGYLAQCVIREETPPGYGFGNAALEISAYMRMNPATDFGVPVKSQVNVPVNFKPED